MTNDRPGKTREGAAGTAAAGTGDGGGTQHRPTGAIAVVPLWERDRTGVRR